MKKVITVTALLILTMLSHATALRSGQGIKEAKQQDAEVSLSVKVAAIGLGRKVEAGSMEDVRSQKAIQSAADHCQETESVIADKAVHIMGVLRDDDQIYVQPVELLEMVASIKTWLDTDADCSSLFALYAVTRKSGMDHLDAYYGIYKLHQVASELASPDQKNSKRIP